MREIQVLDNGLINKIAAGEVVERPVSIVKELVENAIDAGATKISIEISDGGISFIKISDNGWGIPKEQVKTAFLRHATSKIKNLTDLENVLSLGFRGEALSSIAAISQVEILTKTKDENTGIRLVIEGGKVISENEAGMVDGTTFIIKNVFFNTPARRKFLKKPSTESGYISDIVHKFAIGRPEIAFTYINNGSEIFKTNGNSDLNTALLNVYGKETAKNLIPVSINKNGITLSGFAGKPVISRGNRAYEHFFINGRYIKSDIVQSAVENAYKTKLMGGRFPFFIIKMDIAPHLVDVNVHPAKLEVRFAHEEEVYAVIYEAVSSALKSESLIPEVKIPQKFSEITQTPVFTAPVQNSIADIVYKTTDRVVVKEDYQSFSNSNEGKRVLPWEDFKKEKEDVKPVVNYKVIGQFLLTYWLVEASNSLYIIDQHAAHERILFEEITENFKNSKVVTQQLLQPNVIKLSLSEIDTLNDNKELIEKFGFDVESFGENTFAVRSVPYIIKGLPNAGFFNEILDKLSGIDTKISNVIEAKTEAVALSACKAAVKGNDRLSFAEARELIEKLMKLENPYTCPHGRPTIVEISRYEIEKMFKRV